MYHDKQNKQTNKKSHNDSVGSLHVPNTQLSNVLIRTQYRVNWFFAVT